MLVGLNTCSLMLKIFGRKVANFKGTIRTKFYTKPTKFWMIRTTVGSTKLFYSVATYCKCIISTYVDKINAT